MLTFKHQANRRVGDPTPDGDTSEMDWDEFEFAVKKVCEYLKIDPESLLDEEGPRAVAPAENDTKKVFYKKKEGPQAPRPTGPVAQVDTLACTSLHVLCVILCVRASEVWTFAIYSNRHDKNLCVFVHARAVSALRLCAPACACAQNSSSISGAAPRKKVRGEKALILKSFVKCSRFSNSRSASTRRRRYSARS